MNLTVNPNIGNKPTTEIKAPVSFTHKPSPKCEGDSCDCSSKKPQKTSFFQKCKNGCARVQKFFIMTGAFAGGLVKGTLLGGLTAGAVLLGNGAYRAVKLGSLAKEAGKNVAKVSTLGKAAAVIAGGTVLIYKMVKAKLNANERTANVDHRWRTKHNEV